MCTVCVPVSFIACCRVSPSLAPSAKKSSFTDGTTCPVGLHSCPDPFTRSQTHPAMARAPGEANRTTLPEVDTMGQWCKVTSRTGQLDPRCAISVNGDGVSPLPVLICAGEILPQVSCTIELRRAVAKENRSWYYSFTIVECCSNYRREWKSYYDRKKRSLPKDSKKSVV